MRNKKLWVPGVTLCLIALCWLFASPLLRLAGTLFVNDGPPVAADIILVLGGDWRGERILKGAELARQGFAHEVFISNSGRLYGRSESELSREFAIQQGYSPDALMAARWSASSTLEEGRKAIAELQQRGFHRVLVVTTVWHTARASRIFRRLGARLAPEMSFYFVGSNDVRWGDGEWWVTREGRKVFLMEATKTIADFLGI